LLERHELIGHEITDILEAANTKTTDTVIDLRDAPTQPSGATDVAEHASFR